MNTSIFSKKKNQLSSPESISLDQNTSSFSFDFFDQNGVLIDKPDETVHEKPIAPLLIDPESIPNSNSNNHSVIPEEIINSSNETPVVDVLANNGDDAESENEDESTSTPSEIDRKKSSRNKMKKLKRRQKEKEAKELAKDESMPSITELVSELTAIKIESENPKDPSLLSLASMIQYSSNIPEGLSDPLKNLLKKKNAKENSKSKNNKKKNGKTSMSKSARSTSPPPSTLPKKLGFVSPNDPELNETMKSKLKFGQGKNLVAIGPTKTRDPKWLQSSSTGSLSTSNSDHESIGPQSTSGKVLHSSPFSFGFEY